jgi:dihydrofolate reductase
MRKIIEYTLVTLDGVTADPQSWIGPYANDEEYVRDALGQVSACEAMLIGRTTYERFAQIWPRRSDPWAVRLNAMKKYVFSSTLQRADWNNSVIVRGDVAIEAAKLKAEDGGDLLVYGHTRLGETLLRHKLTDVLDVAIHPIALGAGKQLFRDGQAVTLKLAGTKAYTKIVKLTYELQY